MPSHLSRQNTLAVTVLGQHPFHQGGAGGRGGGDVGVEDHPCRAKRHQAEGDLYTDQYMPKTLLVHAAKMPVKILPLSGSQKAKAERCQSGVVKSTRAAEYKR